MVMGCGLGSFRSIRSGTTYRPIAPEARRRSGPFRRKTWVLPLFQRADHRTGRCQQAQYNHACAPQELLPRAAPVVKRQPVANESRRDIEDNDRLLSVMRFMFAKHCPDVRHAQPFKLAMPLPGMLTVGPAVFEGKGV